MIILATKHATKSKSTTAAAADNNSLLPKNMDHLQLQTILPWKTTAVIQLHAKLIYHCSYKNSLTRCWYPRYLNHSLCNPCIQHRHICYGNYTLQPYCYLPWKIYYLHPYSIIIQVWLWNKVSIIQLNVNWPFSFLYYWWNWLVIFVWWPYLYCYQVGKLVY